MFHQATISRGELELLRRVAHVVRAGHISFSAAAIAYVEATVADDERKNTLCRPMPYGEALSTLPAVLSTELGNQAEWAQEPGLRDWARAHRPTGFGTSPGGPADAVIAALRREMTVLRPRAMANLARLVRQPSPPAGGKRAPMAEETAA